MWRTNQHDLWRLQNTRIDDNVRIVHVPCSPSFLTRIRSNRNTPTQEIKNFTNSHKNDWINLFVDHWSEGISHIEKNTRQFRRTWLLLHISWCHPASNRWVWRISILTTTICPKIKHFEPIPSWRFSPTSIHTYPLSNTYTSMTWSTPSLYNFLCPYKSWITQDISNHILVQIMLLMILPI